MTFPVLWKFAGILSAALSQSSQENPTPNKTNEKVLDLTVEEEGSLTVKVHGAIPLVGEKLWLVLCLQASKQEWEPAGRDLYIELKRAEYPL